MDGIELLLEEHENIKKGMTSIKQECAAILEGKEVNTAWFRELIWFCRNYADQHHHGKEEKILFRLMMQELGPVAEKLIKSGMLVEHDLGRFHIAELEKALDEYDGSKETRWKLEIITNASEYAGILFRHIEKENEVVYPFAKRSLSKELLKQMNEETAEFEKTPESEAARALLKWLEQ